MKGGESQTLPKWQEVATRVSWTMTKADAAELNGAVKGETRGTGTLTIQILQYLRYRAVAKFGHCTNMYEPVQPLLVIHQGLGLDLVAELLHTWSRNPSLLVNHPLSAW